MSEERVLNALKALRDADVEWQAGPELEARLVQAFRRRRRRVWRRVAVAIAAGFVVVALGLMAWRVTQMQPERMVVLTPPAPAPPAIAAAAEPPKPRPVRRSSAPQLREVVTEFFPLMDVPPPFERGELVRMTFPASTLRNAGFEVEGSGPDDAVEAEVLVGREGLARAIRFVSYRQ
jgi:hypothetical protein